MLTFENRVQAMIFGDLVIWGKIRADDEKMMFCTFQAAHVIPAEQMIELSMAAHILDVFPRDDAPDGYLQLKKKFHHMIWTAIRDASALADDHGIAQ